MSLTESFMGATRELTDRVYAANRDQLNQAGEWIGSSLARDGVLHTFGSGHSGILAQEIVHRAGGLVPVSAITDPTGGWAENIPLYGAKLFRRHAWTYGVFADEVVIVISNSGKNPTPVDVALGAKEAGARVIAITSLEMSKAAKSDHPSGKRLFEVADLVFDNLGIPGDAALEVPGRDMKTAPMSTMSGALLLNLIVLAAMDYMVEHDHAIPLLISGNLPGGKEHNDRLSEKYRGRLSRPI